MKTVKIEGKTRSEMGKKAARDIRSAGEVPAVIYGGKEEVHFTAPILSFRPVVYTPEFMICEISIEGKTYRCILKDLQFDVVTDRLSHVDFLELVDDKKVIANIPLNFVGQPDGVKAGGRLILKMKSLKVRTMPQDLVESIEVNISDLQLNGNLRVEDVQVKNMQVMNPMRQPVASIVMTRALRQAETETKKGK